MASLSSQESQLLGIIQQYPKGVSQQDVQKEMPQDILLQELVGMLNKLSSRNMIEFLRVGNNVVYRAVKTEESNRMATLDGDERLIYQHIKSSGNEGIWTKILKNKTNLHQNIVTKCLKSLESKGIVKAVKSVKAGPTRKVYMLAEFTPSAEITGGPWFTDSELDVEFIDKLANVCLRYIARHSYPPGGNAVYSTSYYKYASASQIRTHIRDLKITPVDLSLEDIIALLEVLVHDRKIERTGMASGGGEEDSEEEADLDKKSGGDVTYRAVRDVRTGNGWTEVPCGTCPVFSMCTDDGLISPGNCAYMERWLDF